MQPKIIIEIQEVSPRVTAVVRRRTNVAVLPTVIPHDSNIVWEFAKAERVPGIGQPVVLYLTCDAEMNMDVEIGFQIDGPFEGNSEVFCSQIPGGKIAIAVHRGPYDGITGTHMAMHEWFVANNQPITGVSWELYGHWSDNSADLETEICYQLK